MTSRSMPGLIWCGFLNFSTVQIRSYQIAERQATKLLFCRMHIVWPSWSMGLCNKVPYFKMCVWSHSPSHANLITTWFMPSRRSSRIEHSCISELRHPWTTEQSPSLQTQHHQNRGRRLADIGSIVTSGGAWGGGERVCSNQDGSASLAGISSLPDHGEDWAGKHVYNQDR